MAVLVSACLLGENCKYNGGNNYNRKVAEWIRGEEVIPVCPEMLAGLGVPRTPIELVNGIAWDAEGNCPHEQLQQAIRSFVESLELSGIRCAVLKSRSPTCGVKQIYDGSFAGKLKDGSGLFAQALQEAGCRVIDVEDL